MARDMDTQHGREQTAERDNRDWCVCLQASPPHLFLPKNPRYENTPV